MLKLCLIVPEYLPVPAVKGGAIETLVTNLALENTHSHKADITIVSPYDEQASAIAPRDPLTHFIAIPHIGTAHRLLSRYSKGAFNHFTRHYQLISDAYYGKVLRQIRDTNYDAVIFEGGPAQGYSAYGKLFGNRLFYHLHYCPDRSFTNYCFPNVLSVSKFAANCWNRYNKGRHASVQIVRNGEPLEPYWATISHEKREQFRARLGIRPGDFVVLYVGRIIPEKGTLQLIHAISRIQDPSVRLLLIGSSNFADSTVTPYLSEVKKELSKLGDRVIETGYIPHEQLPLYLKSADMQAVPSMCEEAASLAALEAMASGLPLVITRSGGMPEYVGNNCAIVVEKDNYVEPSLTKSILHLKQSPQLRNRMSQAGIERSHEFTNKAFYSNFLKTVQKMLISSGNLTKQDTAF